MKFDTFFYEWVKRRIPMYGQVIKSKDDPTRPTDDDAPKRSKFNFNRDEFLKRREQATANAQDDGIADISEQLGLAAKHFGMAAKWKNNHFEEFPKDGSIMYRGHKHLDPWSFSSDAKADPKDGVYWSNNLEYVFNVYSKQQSNGSSQIGQRGSTELQKKTNKIVGYVTIGTPKDADSIRWYLNFGYEDKKEPFLRTQRNLRYIYDAEAIANQTAFRKLRTYVIYYSWEHAGYVLIPVYAIQKHYPEVYKLMINGGIS